ncbi:MAG: Tfp pilus assembly protein FimT/FimU [Gemmatimonadales bacterium]
MKQGFTLLELIVVLTLMGLFISLAYPRVGRMRDGWLVGAALTDLATFYRTSRYLGVVRGERIRLEISADSLVALSDIDGVRVMAARPGPSYRGVYMSSSGNIVRFYPSGMGRGASNIKIVLWRGMAAGSLTTSRLGRLRLYR